MRLFLFAILFLSIAPVLFRAAVYAASPPEAHWSRADRSPTGIAPIASVEKRAVVQVYAARAYRWRGIFAVHSWIAVKPENGLRFTRYEVMGWGPALRVSSGPVDARWFGKDPELIFDARGEEAARLIPEIEAAVAAYPYSGNGDYGLWPGPNSNSFTASILRAVPGLTASLPPHAIGKDFTPNWIDFMPTPSNTGWQVSFRGYGGAAIGLVEGVELHLLGQTIGIDVLRPALKVPAIGRIGFSRDS